MTLIAKPPHRAEEKFPLTEILPPNAHDRIPTEQDPFADRKRWTQQECEGLENSGLLVPGGYELLSGEIVEKMGQYVRHSRACLRVALALTLTFGADYVLIPVSVPVDAENTPEPDATVTLQTTDTYIEQRTPPLSDVRLFVEVSDATLWRDRNTKMALYAQAGIPEYWVLDISGHTLWVHRDPTATGYADIKEYNETASLTPLTAPNGTAPIAVANLLP